ncbi:MAG TPA: hypothetical protein VK445_11960 [Dissulfurispiraceae bacterium]|nr:hypothetical protein [Dissulfurispiraceae bacterium]
MGRRAITQRKIHPLLWIVEPITDHMSYFDKSMFGCRAVYLHGRLMLVLASGDEPWNGLLIPTEHRFHDAIRKDFADVEQHPVLKKWLYLRQSAENFENTAADIVEAIRLNDERFGVELKEKTARKGKPRNEARE